MPALNFPPARLAAVAGAVTGCLIVAAIVWSERAAPSPDAIHKLSPEAASKYLAAYQRSQTRTWVVESYYEREVPPGKVQLSGNTREVQRPPDRLHSGLGGVEGRIGNTLIGCREHDGKYSCRRSEAKRTWEEELKRNMILLRDYVVGPDPLYSVQLQKDCFQLTQRYAYPLPPYGKAARFCFDRTTGAPTFTEIRKIHSVDRTKAIRVEPDPSDADLIPPEHGSVAIDRSPSAPSTTDASKNLRKAN